MTVLIAPEGRGNAWLNAFELDGGDPVQGISKVSPADQEFHHDAAKGLSWTAGKSAAGVSAPAAFSASLCRLRRL